MPILMICFSCHFILTPIKMYCQLLFIPVWNLYLFINLHSGLVFYIVFSTLLNQTWKILTTNPVFNGCIICHFLCVSNDLGFKKQKANISLINDCIFKVMHFYKYREILKVLDWTHFPKSVFWGSNITILNWEIFSAHHHIIIVIVYKNGTYAEKQE